ncbi:MULTISPECIES: hypothetical protein [Thermus]|uniref:Uncharacterized protein n=1 Tax=Thermus scotoductus TaxID=37636 RepID=A0A430UTB8_THESC|nr:MULTISPECIES: hypothetical protein [Thermus]QWK21899.1 MAG: hypothetical protein KNN15_13020 [Thermus antranikianii]RTI11878.1 hypothetical protein CSW27_11425 [Thermus scotoductus]
MTAPRAEVPEIPRERGFMPLPKGWRSGLLPGWGERRLGEEYEYRPEETEAWVYVGRLRLWVKRLARAA